MKQLKRDGRIFRIAYGLQDPSAVPASTGLCRIFWRMVFMVFVGWPAFYALRYGLYYAVQGTALLVSAHRLARNSDHTLDAFVPIARWPAVRGKRIWPSLCLLAAAFLYLSSPLIGYAWAHLGTFTGVVAGTIKFVAAMVVIGVIGCAAIAALLTLKDYAFEVAAPAMIRGVRKSALRISESEEWEFIMAFGEATKKNLCPIIEIEPAPALVRSEEAVE
jgi:hypothetical protein